MKCVAMLMAMAMGASSASAQSVRVIDDQRAEIIGILFRIAGASDFSNGNVQPYTRQVDSAFTPYRNHPVFVELNRLRAAYGIMLSDVVSMAPQLTDPVTFGERAPIDAPTSTLARSWRGAAARPFLTEARNFAKVARVADFLRMQQPVFDSATARARRLIETRAHLDWFTNFYGEVAQSVLIIAPLLATSSGNFAADFRDGAIHERYAFLAVPSADAAGFPVLHPETLATLVHELNHSYVNHVLDAMRVTMQPAGEKIFPAVRAEMNRLAYNSAQVMFNESVVRAGVIRYLLTNESASAARAETQLQRGLGFVWMDELVELLGDYEAHRATYPSFSAFAPRLVDFYNGLAPRIDRVRDAYDKRRPRIIAASIANGARDVDPSLRALVLTFDTPVSTTYTLLGNLGSGLPEFTGASFDVTRTRLTIGIRLKPGSDYAIPFGPGFMSDDGYPNQRFDLSFRTSGDGGSPAR